MKTNRILIIFLVMTFLLSACKGTKLAEGFDENSVAEHAKGIVELINAKDFDSVNSELRDDLESQLTANQLQEAMETKLDEAGQFVQYKSIAIVGQKSKTTGEDYATAVVVGEYEKGNLIFTITMNIDLEIVGIYLK